MSGDIVVTLPDGKPVSFPAGTPRDTMERALADYWKANAPRSDTGGTVNVEPPATATPQGNYVDNLGRQFAKGGTFGFADEISAAANATLKPVMDRVGRYAPLAFPTLPQLGTAIADEVSRSAPGQSWNERYTANLGRERGRDKAFSDENPVAAGVANAGGAISSALATLPSWALGGGAVTLPGQMMRGAASGGVLGGVTGFGNAEGDERLPSAALSAGLGVGLGGAFPLAARGVGGAWNWAAETAPGRWVSQNVKAPIARGVADLADRLTPTIAPRSLSAAAPDGGPLPADSVMARLSSAATGVADDAANPARGGAIRRLTTGVIRDDVPTEAIGEKLIGLGPGATLQDAAGRSVQRLGRGAYVAPGRGPQIIDEVLDPRNRATGARIIEAADNAAGEATPFAQAFAAAREQRAKTAAAAYAEADEAAKVSPEMKLLMDVPRIKETIARISKEADELGEQLSPLQLLHRVKRQLNADADAAFMAGKSVNKDSVGKLADRWHSALTSANPKLKAADAAYQADSAAMNAMELGRKFMRAGVNEQADAVSSAALAKLTRDELDGFVIGMIDTIKSDAARGPEVARRLAKAFDQNDELRKRLTIALGDKDAKTLLDRARAEMLFAKTDRFTRGGSDTASKLTDLMDQGLPALPGTGNQGMMSTAWNLVRNAADRHRAGNEEIRNELSRMLFKSDPNEALQILQAVEQEMMKRRGASAGRVLIPTLAGQVSARGM